MGSSCIADRQEPRSVVCDQLDGFAVRACGPQALLCFRGQAGRRKGEEHATHQEAASELSAFLVNVICWIERTGYDIIASAPRPGRHLHARIQGETTLCSMMCALSIVVALWRPLAAAETPQTESESSELVQQIQAALKAANAEYQGGGKFHLRDGKIHTISLMRCKGIHDLSPLSQFSLESVKNVVLYNAVNISDLSPLKQCRLTALNTERCAKITDLSPLKGMPIRGFRMYACKGVRDLSPLEGMPLRHLDLGLNPLIDDISPLKGMPLTDLRIDNCPKITDISVIRGMPLKFLSVFGSKGIEDFSPILELPLETLFFSPSLLSDEVLKGVRDMRTLKVMGTSWGDYGKRLTPAQFWERHDGAEAK